MPVDIYVKVGRRIRAKRMEQHETLKLLAERAGITPPTLSRIEQGKSQFGITRLYTIAKALNLRMEDLVR